MDYIYYVINKYTGMDDDIYKKYCDIIARYIENYVGDDAKNYQIPHRDKIRYYLTTKTIKLSPAINQLMDSILKYELNQNPILDIGKFQQQIILVKHDITQIKCDAIVNAANSKGLGCFEPDHKCIDNIIHNKAGPNLRLECETILKGREIETSGLIVTDAYNLPCKKIIHVVGPIYNKNTHNKCASQLLQCYINCLKTAHNNNFNSIVFCCISTGLYGFPAGLASKIATTTVKKFVKFFKPKMKIIFCTYSDKDYDLYQKLIG